MKVKIDLNSVNMDIKLKLLIDKCGVLGVRELVLDLAEDNYISLNCSLDLMLERFKADEVDLDKVG